MELLQLKYFCEAARVENLSKCAAKFRVPPSDVSQTVKRLEAELGVSLFERRSNKVRLSARGRLFYKRAQAALELLADGVRELTEQTDVPRGELRLLVLSNRRLVTEAIERFRLEYPEVSFTISHRPASESSGYDCTVSDDLSLGCTHDSTPLLSERILLAHSGNSRLSSAEEITPEMLAREGFVFMDDDSSLARVSRSVCQAMGFEPRIAIRTDDPYYVRKYVEMNLGVALIPEKSWRGQLGCDTVLRELGDFKRTTYAFVKRGSFISRALSLFLEALSDTAKDY